MSKDFTISAELSNQPAADAAPLAQRFRELWKMAGRESADQWLIARLNSSPSPAWLVCMVDLAKTPELAALVTVLAERALQQFPEQINVRYAIGLILRDIDERLRAEGVFRAILATHPGHTDTGFMLAELLRNSGRIAAACDVIALVAREQPIHNVDVSIRCVGFLRQCQNAVLALQICEKRIEEGVADPRLRYLAGELAMSLGRFEPARQHFESFLHYSSDPAARALALLALSDLQRYDTPTHADLGRIRNTLSSPNLPGLSRAALHFAYGKCNDDLGRCQEASFAWREANQIIHGERPWPRANWEAAIRAQMAAPLPRFAIPPNPDFVPVFIVGMPRSGTTLLNRMLGRSPQSRTRGEMNWVDFIWSELGRSGRAQDPAAVFQASRLYYSHLRQDDEPRRYYVDKNPLNFRYLGTIVSMFPNARFLYCRRHRADVGLSLWSRYFAAGACEFSYQFDDIATVINGCEVLMDHWKRTLPAEILEVAYEDLVNQTEPTMRGVFQFLELDPPAEEAPVANEGEVVGTSSIWQARQPIYESAVGRWASYAEYIPELKALALGGMR